MNLQVKIEKSLYEDLKSESKELGMTLASYVRFLFSQREKIKKDLK